MDDAGVVGFGHRLARLRDELGGDLGREASAFFDEPLEVDPFEELHHHERRAVFDDAYIEHPRDVCAPELRGGTRFEGEPAGRDVPAQLRAHELEGDRLIELDVLGGEDEPHPSRGDLAVDDVFSGDHLPRLDRRRRRRRHGRWLRHQPEMLPSRPARFNVTGVHHGADVVAGRPGLTACTRRGGIGGLSQTLQPGRKPRPLVRRRRRPSSRWERRGLRRRRREWTGEPPPHSGQSGADRASALLALTGACLIAVRVRRALPIDRGRS